MQFQTDADHPGFCRSWVIDHGNARRLQADRTLTAPTSGFLYLISGALLLTFATSDGETPGLAATFLFEDELLDIAWLRLLPSCSIRSVSDATNALLIDERDRPHMPSSVLDRSSGLTLRFARQLIAATSFPLQARLSSLLVKFGARIGKLRDDHLEFDLPVPRESLAAYTGVRTETLSRGLRRAEKEGLITLTGWRHVTILDWDAVCRASPLTTAIISSIPASRRHYLGRLPEHVKPRDQHCAA